MTATIPSAQLQAITRLEFASEALNKALRAVQHPELEFAGGTLVAPSGLKHLVQIRTTVDAIESAIRPSEQATSSDAFAYDRQRARLAEATVSAFRAADDALERFETAQNLLTQLPDETPSFEDDSEIVTLVCECRTERGEPRVERVTRGTWRTLVGFCAKCRGQIHEI